MFKGKKTYITGAVGIITAIAAYLVGDADLGTTVNVTFGLIMAMTIRHGVTTETAKKLVLGFLCVGTLFMFTPSQANANPAFLFVATMITGTWSTLTYEECKTEGLTAKECAKREWRNREVLDYSKLND
tara:strand:- start:782 stop:1168 length:387 start_codon:yes stop_codon:yes gene_type:complete